jgi:hypothetical protein
MNKPPRIVAAIARLDAKPPQPSRRQRLAQHRRTQAWKKAQQKDAGQDKRDD